MSSNLSSAGKLPDVSFGTLFLAKDDSVPVPVPPNGESLSDFVDIGVS